ncbi:MAG: hypothetical protein QG620_117 [Patescibacteria group bacterium]|nr:hypothetical protein [Patescibacteria group bacterium]
MPYFASYTLKLQYVVISIDFLVQAGIVEIWNYLKP